MWHLSTLWAKHRTYIPVPQMHRISPATRFLGSYGRADGHRTVVEPHTSDQAFRAAHSWVKDILSGASVVPEYTSGASPTA